MTQFPKFIFCPHLLEKQHLQVNFIIRGFHIFKKFAGGWGNENDKKQKVWAMKRTWKMHLLGRCKKSIRLAMLQLLLTVMVPEKKLFFPRVSLQRPTSPFRFQEIPKQEMRCCRLWALGTDS